MSHENYGQQQAVPSQGLHQQGGTTSGHAMPAGSTMTAYNPGGTPIGSAASSTGSFGQGVRLSDRDRMNDLLASSKYLSSGLNTFAHEASSQWLHRDVCQALMETHQQSQCLSSLMFQKGWYSVQSEHPQQIAQAYQQFSGFEQELRGTGDGRLGTF